MLRVLRLYWYYFSWQRTMTWVTMIGVAMCLLGLTVASPSFGSGLVALGSLLAVLFPIVFGGFAYRVIIANRRFLMLPDIRTYAATALLLLALTGAAVVLVFAAEFHEVRGTAALMKLTLIAFAGVSAYLLISQWLATYALGLFSLAVLPLVLFGIAADNHEILSVQLTDFATLAALACLGWIWLMVTTRQPTLPRPIGVPNIASGASPELKDGRGNYQWVAHGGAAATSTGTLLRGASDGWRSRILTELAFLLSFPAVMAFVVWIVEASFPPSARRPSGIALFLFASFVGLTVQTQLAFGEWPARLRTLWLRMAGDRAAGWRLMERTLVEEAFIVGISTTVIAAVSWLLVPVPPKYLLLYVITCVVMTFAASYNGFWIRAAGWHRLANLMCVLGVILLTVGLIVALPEGRKPNGLFWCLPVLAVLALGLRMLARSRLLRIDWCVVRPLRAVRVGSKAG